MISTSEQRLREAHYQGFIAALRYWGLQEDEMCLHEDAAKEYASVSKQPEQMGKVSEQHIRVAIWNAIKKYGYADNNALSIVDAAMAEPLMVQSLTTLHPMPQPLDRDGVLEGAAVKLEKLANACTYSDTIALTYREAAAHIRDMKVAQGE